MQRVGPALEDIMELDELISYAINREVLISQKMKIKEKEIEPSIAYCYGEYFALVSQPVCITALTDECTHLVRCR